MTGSSGDQFVALAPFGYFSFGFAQGGDVSDGAHGGDAPVIGDQVGVEARQDGLAIIQAHQVDVVFAGNSFARLAPAVIVGYRGKVFGCDHIGEEHTL